MSLQKKVELDQKNQYMKEQFERTKMLSTSLYPINPSIGQYINVNGGMPFKGLDISQDYFPEEFETIKKAYEQVFEKLQEYEKN